jgi:large subunit ribosomal protein L28
MSKRCQVSNKGPQFGHRVSHANNKTKHAFLPNLQSKRIFVPELGKTLRLKVSTRMIRSFDKLGVLPTLKKFGVEVPTA